MTLPVAAASRRAPTKVVGLSSGILSRHEIAKKKNNVAPPRSQPLLVAYTKVVCVQCKNVKCVCV